MYTQTHTHTAHRLIGCYCQISPLVVAILLFGLRFCVHTKVLTTTATKLAVERALIKTKKYSLLLSSLFLGYRHMHDDQESTLSVGTYMQMAREMKKHAVQMVWCYRKCNNEKQKRLADWAIDLQRRFCVLTQPKEKAACIAAFESQMHETMIVTADVNAKINQMNEWKRLCANSNQEPMHITRVSDQMATAIKRHNACIRSTVV